MNLNVDIRRLTLPGYSPAEQRRFSDALQRAVGELWSQGSAQRSLRTHDVQVSLRAGASPEEAAQQIAAQLIGRVDAARGHRG